MCAYIKLEATILLHLLITTKVWILINLLQVTHAVKLRINITQSVKYFTKSIMKLHQTCNYRTQI